MASVLVILSVNHHHAPLELRERLAFSREEVVSALARLKRSAPAVSEAALLSTCNRVELMAVGADAAQAASEGYRFLGAERTVGPEVLGGLGRDFVGREAVRHLFRVGASLDSMVLGEPQILGQLKLAYLQAVEAGSAGLVLHRAFHRAFAVAKQVRQATLVGRGAASVSSASVAMAERIFDTLGDKTALLIGAGEMAELTARHLKGRGIGKLLITNRTFERAAAIADEVGGVAVPFDLYPERLKSADIVIGSVTTAKPLLTTEQFEGVVRERRYRPMFLIDLGVPRNFDERLNSLENVYLYDIDDLGAVVRESRQAREQEAEKAEVIVEQNIESFCRWLDGLALVPTIKEIRGSIEQLRDYELKRHRGWLRALGPDEQARVESLTRGLVNKVLHRIVSGLRDEDGAGATGETYAAEIARRLLCRRVAEEESEDEEGGGELF